MGIFAHSSSRTFARPDINVGREGQAHSLRSSSSQRCSMQLRSLLSAGQSSFSTLNPSNHVFMDFMERAFSKLFLQSWKHSIVQNVLVCCRACERSGAGSERGAERAKSSRSAERVFIQRPERSLCLAPVPLRYRSHHESRASTNPPRIHLCLQQLTKLSAYTSKIIREIFPKANRRCIDNLCSTHGCLV